MVGGLDFVAEAAGDQGAVDLGFAVVPGAFEMSRSVSSAFAEIGKRWNGGLTSTRPGTSFAARCSRSGWMAFLKNGVRASCPVASNSENIGPEILAVAAFPIIFALCRFGRWRG